LAGKDIDPNVNQAIDEIEPETALFLSLIIDDVMSKTERNQLISRIRKALEVLVDKQREFDQKMKDRIKTKRAKDEVNALLGKGIQSLQGQVLDH